MSHDKRLLSETHNLLKMVSISFVIIIININIARPVNVRR